MKTTKNLIGLLITLNVLFSCPSMAQIGSWPTSGECNECLNDPDMVMQNADNTITKPRTLYVDDFAMFASTDISDPDLYYSTHLHSILGNAQKEKELLEYACEAGFNELILYTVPQILKRKAGRVDNDPGNLTWDQHLAMFIVVAKQAYNIDVGFNVSGELGALADSENNIIDYYDLTSLNNQSGMYRDDFRNNFLASCDFSFSNGTPPITRIYPFDSEGREHPLDIAINGLLLMGQFGYDFSSGMHNNSWWNSILSKIEKDYGHGDPGFIITCFSDIPVLLYNPSCHSYKFLVSEYEFWNDQSTLINTYNTLEPASSSASCPNNEVNVTHNVYDIENGFEEGILLVDIMNCVISALSTDLYAQFQYSCPLEAHAYLIQLASASVKSNGKYNYDKSDCNNSISHYVFNSDWNPNSLVNYTVRDYDFDSRCNLMAKEIDERIDRLYLATYRKTPCHLWSDDVVKNSQSYGRRFKDVYAYFAQNGLGALNNTTNIYPLFSARDLTIDHDFDPIEPGTWRNHLGLYLSNSQDINITTPYSEPNGFTGSLGGAEDIFTHFSLKELEGCSTSVVPVFTGTAPTNGSPILVNNITTGQNFKLTNIIANTLYQIELTDVNGTSISELVTIRKDNPISGQVIATKYANFSFKPRESGTYYFIYNKGGNPNNGTNGCTVHGTNPPQRNFVITNLGTTGFPTVDPNPMMANYYDNSMNGFGWYRRTNLLGVWGAQASATPWSFYKTEQNKITEDKVKNLHENTIKIYPNPSSGNLLKIETSNLLRVEIVDLRGSVLRVSEKNQLNLKGLSNGFYYLIIYTKDKKHIKSFIKSN